MSRCSDVMKPIESASCCTPQDSAAQAAQVMRDYRLRLRSLWLRIQNRLSRSVSSLTVARVAAKVGVEEIIRPLFACYGASKTVKGTRRKLHAHRVTSLPVADKAGGYQ